MAGEKSSKAGNDSDSAKTGNSCGFSLGCLVIIVAIAAVIFFLFIKPALKDAGYSYDDIKDKALELKEKADDTINQGREIYQNSKEKYEDIKTGADDAVDQGKEIYRDSREKYEDIKDKAGEQVDKSKTLNPGEQEDLNRTAPKLIADD